MTWIRVLVVILGLVEGIWMTFDGTRALIVGDYVTPSSGVHAGELGPWNHVVKAVGIPPRSTTMKLIIVAYGLAWLLITVAFAFRAPWAWRAMLIAAFATLWYLPVGTVIGIIQTIALIGIGGWLHKAAI
jgi:hypothetical protein